jgi:hypothetical protein
MPNVNNSDSQNNFMLFMLSLSRGPSGPLLLICGDSNDGPHFRSLKMVERS